jgi:hypothetical protein
VISVIDAIAADVGQGGPVSLQDVLSDPSVFLDSARWFMLLQDDGKEMTCQEICEYASFKGAMQFLVLSKL